MRPGGIEAPFDRPRRRRRSNDGSAVRIRNRQAQLPGDASNSLESRRPVTRRSGWRHRFANGAAGDWQRQTLVAGGRYATGAVSVVPEERGKCMAYRILIVDDSPAMRSFVRRVIILSGFELSTCFEAWNGQEALDLAGSLLYVGEWPELLDLLAAATDELGDRDESLRLRLTATRRRTGDCRRD